MLKNLLRSVARSPRILLAAVLALTAIGATAAEAPEIKRRADNETRLAKMHVSVRPKVRAVLRDLDSHGLKPVIHADVHRTPARQAELKRRGHSKVSYSFHTVTGKNDKPEALAADIIGFYQGYNVDNVFWLKLASSARAHGLQSGITWGLSRTERERIDQLIQSKAWSFRYRRGWDPAHVEPKPTTLTLAQAKAGKRPVFR